MAEGRELGMRAGRQFFYTDDVLKRALDAQTLRLHTTAHNLANANTPNFKRGVVQFEAALRQELERELPQKAGGVRLQATHPGHLIAPGTLAGAKGRGPTARPQVTVDRGTTMRNDDNNVDPDREAVELARTQLTYQALTRVVAERYRRLRSVVQQGGR